MTLLPSLLLLVLLLLQKYSCEERRSDVMRAVLGDSATEPGFWPTRGRRADSSSEEQAAPPFWAHRGRELSLSGLYQIPPGFFALHEPKLVLLQRSKEVDKPDTIWVNRGRKRSIQ